MTDQAWPKSGSSIQPINRMNNLRTDSVPLGTMPIPDREVPEDIGPEPLPQNRPRNQNSIPKVVNITGGSGIHIGPVFHVSGGMKPKKKMEPEPMPTRREVDALRLCHRQIEDSDKFVVSEHLGNAWRSLGRAMCFSSGQLENIEADFSRNADKTNELLSQWHDRESNLATVARLTDLIIAIKAYHVLMYLKPAY